MLLPRSVKRKSAAFFERSSVGCCRIDSWAGSSGVLGGRTPTSTDEHGLNDEGVCRFATPSIECFGARAPFGLVGQAAYSEAFPAAPGAGWAPWARGFS